jgi:hypothetical protein
VQIIIEASFPLQNLQLDGPFIFDRRVINSFENLIGHLTPLVMLDLMDFFNGPFLI